MTFEVASENTTSFTGGVRLVSPIAERATVQIVVQPLTDIEQGPTGLQLQSGPEWRYSMRQSGSALFSPVFAGNGLIQRWFFPPV